MDFNSYNIEQKILVLAIPITYKWQDVGVLRKSVIEISIRVGGVSNSKQD
jgi:hypothetical protein